MRRHRLIKRTVDIFLALAVIFLTMPIQLTIFIILLFNQKENPIYLQKRGLTIEKFRFTIIKFRTISSSKIKLKQHLNSKDIFLMPNLAIDLNPFTKWLRRTGLDELPQIYNVLFGHMSFIGPRPLMIHDLEILRNEFPTQYELRENITSKPGITGVWQIIGDRSLGAENLIGLDLFYEMNKSFWLDLNIFFATIPLILFAKNSDAIVPRIDFISKLFSLSLGEVTLDQQKQFHLIKVRKEKSNTYTLKIPLNWWYMSDSYSNSKRPATKIIDIIDGKEVKQKLSK